MYIVMAAPAPATGPTGPTGPTGKSNILAPGELSRDQRRITARLAPDYVYLYETGDPDMPALALVDMWVRLEREPAQALVTQKEFDAAVSGAPDGRARFRGSTAALRACISVVGMGTLWQTRTVAARLTRSDEVYPTADAVLATYGALVDCLPGELRDAVRAKIHGAYGLAGAPQPESVPGPALPEAPASGPESGPESEPESESESESDPEDDPSEELYA